MTSVVSQVTGQGSSIGSMSTWHASGPKFDPHVRHILWQNISYMFQVNLHKKIYSWKMKLEAIIKSKNEPTHEILALFVLHKKIHSWNTHVQPYSGARCLVFGHTLRLLPYFMCANSEGSGELCICAVLPEPLLLTYAISTIVSWAGSNDHVNCVSSFPFQQFGNGGGGRCPRNWGK